MGKAVMFEQLVEVGPGEREKKIKEGRDGMLNRTVTGWNHWLACQTDHVLSIWRPRHPPLWASGGSERHVCVRQFSCYVTCKYHKAFLSERVRGLKWNKVLNSTRGSKRACLCCYVHAPGPDYFMVFPKYTVPSVKWGLKGAVLSPVCVSQDSKVLLWAPFATCWACSLASQRSSGKSHFTVSKWRGDSAWHLREWMTLLQCPLVTGLTGIAQGLCCRGLGRMYGLMGEPWTAIFLSDFLANCPSCFSQLDSSLPYSCSVRKVRRSFGHRCDSITQNEPWLTVGSCFAGWPASSYGASKLSTDPRGEQWHRWPLNKTLQ